MPDRPPVPLTARVREWLDLVRWAKRLGRDLPPIAGDLGIPELLSRPLGACSLGQQRRVGLVAALMGDPQVILLDEPDRGLDAAAMQCLQELLRWRAAHGRLSVLSSHDAACAARIGACTMVLGDQGSSPCADTAGIRSKDLIGPEN
jgi:ABC-type multidrug transport system ATPase subunit